MNNPQEAAQSTSGSEAKPKSLLSFLYNVMYDTDTRLSFHKDPIGTARSFGISDQTLLDAINTLGPEETGSTSGNRQAWDPILKALGDELHEGRNTFW